jgi:glucose-6-phosphate 1-dehydrogenase
VHFKPTPLTLFRGADGGDLAPNVMRLRIDPAPGSATRFNVKRS